MSRREEQRAHHHSYKKPPHVGLSLYNWDMDTLIITPEMLPTPEMVMNPNLDKEAHAAWHSGKTTEESLERLAAYLNIPIEPLTENYHRLDNLGNCDLLGGAYTQEELNALRGEEQPTYNKNILDTQNPTPFVLNDFFGNNYPKMFFDDKGQVIKSVVDLWHISGFRDGFVIGEPRGALGWVSMAEYARHSEKHYEAALAYLMHMYDLKEIQPLYRTLIYFENGRPMVFEPISDDATVTIVNLDHEGEGDPAARNNAGLKSHTPARDAVQRLVSLFGRGVQAIKQQLNR